MPEHHRHPEASATRMPREGRRTAALVVICQVFHFLTFSGIALLLPLIREDLSLTFAEAGMLSAAATVSYALAQFPAGYMADRFGPKRLFFIGLVGWSALCITLALTHWLWLAVINQFFAGLFRALLFAPGVTLLASWFPPDRRATAMSLFPAGTLIGTMVVALVAPFGVDLFGWRLTFILFAVLGIAAAVAFRKYGREKPREGPMEQVRLREAIRVFRHPVMWVCSALQFVRFTVGTAFIVWLPSLLNTDRGLTLQAAGLVVAMAAACSAPANWLGGYVSDRLKNPPLVIGISLAVLACTCTLIVTVQPLWLLLTVVAVNAIFVQFYFGPLFLVPLEVLGQRMAGSATGFANLFANIGAFVSALGLGLVKDKAGSFTAGFLGLAVLCVIGVGLSFVLARVRRDAVDGPRHMDRVLRPLVGKA
jgi:nitrate/nitrite transporter NarK